MARGARLVLGDGDADKLCGGHDGLGHLAHAHHLLDSVAVVVRDGALAHLVGAHVALGAPEVRGRRKDGHREAEEGQRQQHQRRRALVGRKDPVGERDADFHGLRRAAYVKNRSAAATGRMRGRRRRAAHLLAVRVAVLDPVIARGLVREGLVRLDHLFCKELARRGVGVLVGVHRLCEVAVRALDGLLVGGGVDAKDGKGVEVLCLRERAGRDVEA